MTETRFHEPKRLSTQPKPLFSLKPLYANLVEVIVTLSLPKNKDCFAVCRFSQSGTERTNSHHGQVFVFVRLTAIRNDRNTVDSR